MSPPGVSVIIVNWNTQDMVLRLLRSLSSPKEARALELELIVVDNNSSDGSVEAIRREFPAVKLVAQTSPTSIAEAAQYMAEFPQVGVLGPRILNPDRSPQSSCWRDPSLMWIAISAIGLSKLKPFNFERYGEKVFAEAAEVDCICGCAMMIRRELLVELGGLDEDYFMYFEETDLCVRVRRRGMQVHHAPVGECLHEDGGTSKTVKLRTYLDFRRSQILFHLKHGGVAAAVAARLLLALGAALRVVPVAALSLVGSFERARAQLELHWQGLRWLVNPSGGLVPDVDRMQ